jgi:hypothetical protein
MSQEDKLVVYYSCFNYEMSCQDFSHIELLLQTAKSSLSPEWAQALSHELQLLNISNAHFSLELCCEVFLSLINQSLPNTYDSFKDLFISELLLSSIWTPGNPEILLIDQLLLQFYASVQNTMIDCQPCEFKLLTRSATC